MIRRVTTEDLSCLPDFTTHPAEVEISTFANRAVSDLAPDSIPREILTDIARAFVDRGWQAGVRNATVTIFRVTERGRPVTHMKVQMEYGK